VEFEASFPSQIRWCLLPVFRRSTGDGPVASPLFLARTWEPSTHARVQSSSPAAFSAASRMRCNLPKTPACCRRSRRRQQVCPEPNSSYRGRSCQATSWCRTYGMPCRHSRSATGFGPGDRSGQGGSNGSISAHKSSSTIHGRVVTPTRTIRPSPQSRPTRTVQQDRVTSSKGRSQPSDHRAGAPRQPLPERVNALNSESQQRCISAVDVQSALRLCGENWGSQDVRGLAVGVGDRPRDLLLPPLPHGVSDIGASASCRLPGGLS